MSSSEVILYTSHDGRVCLKLKTLENTVWLTQAEIADLFGKGRSTVAEHISAIFDDGELEPDRVCRKFRQTADDGKLYDVIHYNPKSDQAQLFFKKVQNKMLWAATHHTAPEIIAERADPNQPNMGLTSWKGSRVRQQDVTIAKNYLNQPEIEELNEIVVMYLDYAENQAKRRKTVTMAEWEQKLDAFLTFNEKDLLDHAGKVSAKVAEKLALERYEEFDGKRREEERKLADAEDITLLEALQEKAKKMESQLVESPLRNDL